MPRLPVKAPQNIPASLQTEISNAALQVQRHAFELYDLLDRRKGPVTVAKIQEELQLNPEQYRTVRQLLSGTSAEIYVTEEGVVLRKLCTSDSCASA